MAHKAFDIDDLGRQLGYAIRNQLEINRAENYGYWLAIKHVVLGLVGILAAYVTWHIPV